jgi:hypothetical protein
VTDGMKLQWPSNETSLTDLVHRLLEMATEVHFVEIGLDGAQVARLDAAKDTVRDIERALGEAMDTDEPEEREAIGRRLMGFLRSLRDDGLVLTASFDQRTVEGAAGVGKLDVLSIVVARQPALQEHKAAA